MFLQILFIALFATVVAVSDIVGLFTPLIVFAVTELIKYFLPTVKTKIPGWLIISFVVPGLSMLVALFIPDQSMGYWVQVIYGLLAVFIREIISQLKQTVTV